MAAARWRPPPDHWLVDDTLIFENMGLTKHLGNVKFLACADCEIGSTGWQCLSDESSSYVASERFPMSN